MNNLNTLPEQNMKHYYVIYCRKSSRPEDKQAASLPRQLDETRRVAKERELDVLQEFTESGTGWINRSDDTSFTDMIDLIEKRGDIAGIITYDSSRLLRNDQDAGKIKKLLINRKLDRIITITETYDYNNLDYFGHRNTLDFNYSYTVSKNVRASVKNRIENGIAPYLPKTGYKYSKDKIKGYRHHVADSRNFELTKKLFELFLTGNYSVAALQRKSVELNIKNTRGSHISKTRLHVMLGDIYYTGKFSYKDNVYAGTHKRMITDGQYEAIQRILSNNSFAKPVQETLPLSGFIKCGECGMSITSEKHTKTYKNGTKQTFTYYRCSKKGAKCSQPYIRESKLEKQVTDYLSTLEVDKDFFALAVGWLKEQKEQETSIRESARKQLELEHTKVIKRLDRLMDLRLDATDEEDMDEIDNKRRTLKIEKKNIKDNLDRLYTRIDNFDQHLITAMDFSMKARELFKNGDLNAKRTVINAVGSNLVLKDKILSIQPQNLFIVNKQASDLLVSEIDRLEPNNSTENKENVALTQQLSTVMRGRRDSNPRPSLRQSDTLTS